MFYCMLSRLDRLHEQCTGVLSLIDDLIMSIFSRQEKGTDEASFWFNNNHGPASFKEGLFDSNHKMDYSPASNGESSGCGNTPAVHFNSTTTSVYASRLVTGCLSLIELALIHAPVDHVSWFERCSDQYVRILVSIHERNPQR